MTGRHPDRPEGSRDDPPSDAGGAPDTEGLPDTGDSPDTGGASDSGGQPAPRRSTYAPTRRDLIAGAVGLVGGAGLGTGATAWFTADTDEVEPRVPSPGEELMTEHGLLKRILLAYSAAAGMLRDGANPPLDAVVNAAGLVSTYVESFHEGLEEAYVFPRVRPDHPDLVRTLLIQHDRGRHLTERIMTAGDLDLSRPDARAALATQLEQFVRMYEPHEAWEDTVIYPSLRAATSQRELDLLGERFADLQNKLYGDTALARLLDRVVEVEAKLGLGDLAQFTPPPP